MKKVSENIRAIRRTLGTGQVRQEKRATVKAKGVGPREQAMKEWRAAQAQKR